TAISSSANRRMYYTTTPFTTSRMAHASKFSPSKTEADARPSTLRPTNTHPTSRLHPAGIPPEQEVGKKTGPLRKAPWMAARTAVPSLTQCKPPYVA
ncbi:hypothetical protein KEM55_006541, partial [Ascosphaera atra]